MDIKTKYNNGNISRFFLVIFLEINLNFPLVHLDMILLNSSGIRQKGESQNGCFKKAKHAKISEKQTFLTP